MILTVHKYDLPKGKEELMPINTNTQLKRGQTLGIRKYDGQGLKLAAE